MAAVRATPRELVAELLRSTTCYDALPHSGKVVVFDVGLPVRLAFFALVEHECTAAPLWDSARGCFAGMVTVTDFIQMMLQYHRAGAAADALSGNTLAAWKAEQARRLAEHTQRPPSGPAARDAAVAGAVPLEVTAAGIGGSAAAPFPFPAGLVQVRPDASLLEACLLLRRHRIHRVAVVPRETDWARGDASAVCDAAAATSKVRGDPMAKHDAALKRAAETRQAERAASGAAAKATAAAAAAASLGPRHHAAVLGGGGASGTGSVVSQSPEPWEAEPDPGVRLLLAAGMVRPPKPASAPAPAAGISSSNNASGGGGGGGSSSSSSSSSTGAGTGTAAAGSGAAVSLPAAAGRRVALSRREGRLEDTPAAATVLGVLTHRSLLHAMVERFSLDTDAVWAGGGGRAAPGSDAGVLSESVAAAGMGTWAAAGRQLVTARVDTPLADVLGLLAAHRVSCVPLVEAGPAGRLVDVWGREDVLFLATDPSLGALSAPVGATRRAQLGASDGVHSVRTCCAQDSVRRVVDTFAATRVSRLVGVDAEGRPVGVVTLADVFQYFTDAIGAGDGAASEAAGAGRGFWLPQGAGAAAGGPAGESIGLAAASDEGQDSPGRDQDDDGDVDEDDDDNVDMG
ncbi:hypothetical protein FNF29_04530 [Cafeteria roenbergensis]|uniref:CBS domain-containing protein n=1 Tax=Cafeteria roenbergensis TaxID=33653 RepID=A0A5A8CF24_CAFRO|nr:hypothetical protein FNF29_04530 [Cafeteria roenbergensis]|eukprot:KAA0151606.1 hypothetical protein FNF29_04530 [Cafeteria roenbergensis]